MNRSMSQKIKIPKNIYLYICDENILTISNSIKSQSIKLNLKVTIEKNKHIFLTKIPVKKFIKKQIINSLFKYYIFLIKKSFFFNKIVKKKLIIKGVGFRVTLIHINKNLVLLLKLGFSHQIYIKIPYNLRIFCPTSSIIYIFGTNITVVNNLCMLLKSCKLPEPYKGKGIFFENEKIFIKSSKKI